MPDKTKEIIGIDASRAEIEQKTGVEYYSFELIKALNALPLEHREIRLYSRVPLPEVLHRHPNIHNRVIKGQRMWTLFRLSFEMLKNPPHRLFIPSHIFPKITPKNAYIFIHDTAFHYFKEAYSLPHYNQLVKSTKQSIKRAKKILTCSESTKRDLVKHFKADPKQVHVIPHGFNPHRLQQKDDSILSLLNIKEAPFILFVGRIEIKKNLINLIKAFEMFHLKHPEFKLVLAGKEGHGSKEVFQTIQTSPAKEFVLTPGYISDKHYTSLLEHAAIFSFPSLYEGFGFPVLEAMDAKTPVVASRSSSLPEVCDDAALLVNPLDPKRITEAFECIINDKVIRDTLIEKGTRRVKEFDWQRCASQTLQAITS